MEINGKEFMRNVSIEQDKERLLAEHKKLEQMKRDAKMRDESYTNETSQDSNSAYVDLSMNKTPAEEENQENIIEDLMLTPEDPNKTKKKYIVLGFGLILLFIITILVIRLISNNETKEKLENINPQTNTLVTDKILDKIDTNEEYQKVIDRKSALDEAAKLDKTKSENMEINIPNEAAVTPTPIVIDTPKPQVEPKRDLFGLDKTEIQKQVVKVEKKTAEATKVIKKEVIVKPKKQTIIKPTEQTNFSQKTTTVAGYFVQIGAFTKAPSKALVNDIVKKGYNYKVHQMNIKGKLYNKVLIGAYPSREVALKDIEKIRKDFKNPNAYILKF